MKRSICIGALALAGCATAPEPPAESAPQAMACPASVTVPARCFNGRDSAGALYVIVLPAEWNGTLVLHAHGGPSLGPPKLERTLEDLQRWNVWVRGGHAFAASSYRQGGVAVRAAAEDTERLRRIFVQHVARPQRTLLHGQSWGASVAAQGAGMYTQGRPYDAVLLSNGVLAGGSRAYDFRIDLRVVYQHYCANHPRADEPPYPLWMGLPAGSTMTPAQLQQRVQECLGVGLPAAQRSAEQARKLAAVARIVRIRDSSVASHLNWATFTFREIADRYGQRPVFGNVGARYTGSEGDVALNAAVPRYRTDPAALAAFAADTDPTGRIPVPVLTVHAVDDPTAFVEMEHSFAQTMAAAGSGERLVQVYTGHAEHSYLADPVYVAAAELLLQWAGGGAKPTAAAFAARCAAAEAAWGSGCRARPDFVPAALDTRVPARER